MDDHTQEIRDDEINVEEIMEKVRENIRRRHGAGELPSDPDSSDEPPNTGTADIYGESFQRDLQSINDNWDIRNSRYCISSHRPGLGKLLVKGRKLVHGEVRRYIDPVITRQTDFNAGITRIIGQTLKTCGNLDRRISLQEIELPRKLSLHDEELTRKLSLYDEELTRRFSLQADELTRKLSLQADELTRKFSLLDEELNINIQDSVDAHFRKIVSQVDKDLRLRMGLAHLLEERIQKAPSLNSSASEPIPADTNYFLFEERFRGSREDIKQRQLTFLPYFKQCSRVLDIGCGRGEFLEILKENHIGGIGVDLDADMVSYCTSRHLDVVQSDAIAYLENLEDKSLDGIFIDQVVEHLEPTDLVQLLALCHRKLKFGYYLVAETVNPLSFSSFVNFYIDLTHKRPLHPETLLFLVHVAGFRECEKKFSSPVSDECRLKKVNGISAMDGAARTNAEVYNQNIELLNTVLFGAQDYAIIGKK